MYKKIISVVLIIMCMFSFSNVNAASQSNFIDLQAYDKVYTMSEDSDVSLPFIKIFTDKATYDKDITKSGLSIASKGIELNKNIKGVQVIGSNDTVQIAGTLEYAVIFAANVEITGTIEKDVLIFAQSVFITENAKIGGDVVIVANEIDLKGNVAGNFIASATSMTMEGNVEKDFRVSSETLEFGEATVGNNIYIETNSELDLSDRYENAVVNKIQTSVLSEDEKKEQTLNTVYKSAIAIALFTLTYVIIKKISPNLFIDISNKVKDNSSYAIIVGVLSLVTIPIVLMLLVMLSIFGLSAITMPLLVAYIAIVIVTIALAKFITGAVIYELVKDKLKVDTKLKEVATLIGIYAGLYILCNIPRIASIMIMATILVSAGIVVTAITKKNKEGKV